MWTPTSARAAMSPLPFSPGLERPPQTHVSAGEQSHARIGLAIALLDARDGLKRVHRRILYSMAQLGLTPTTQTL